jgi:DNA-binding transcriptional ArsR family regulator
MDSFIALADPLRANIVQLLAHRDMNAGEIAARFPVTRPAVSRHLSVLLKSKLVRVRDEAQRRIYSLNADGLGEVSDWVDQCRATWERRLDRLGDHLDAAAQTGGED